MIVRLIAFLAIVAALVALYFFAALKWSYSDGERAGWVQKLSRKGWVCKTWEGELAMVSLPGSAPEKFVFTILDDQVAQRVTQAMGKRVSLHYEEKVGLPTTCFGETRHYVVGITVSDEIPLAPGVTLPMGPAAVPPAALPAPASASAAASVPAAAPVQVPAPAASRPPQ